MDWYYPVLRRRARPARRGQRPPGRRLGHVRDGGPRRALRERRAVGHRRRDGRVRPRPPRRRRRRDRRADLLRLDARATATTTARTGPASSTPSGVTFPDGERTRLHGRRRHPRRRRPQPAPRRPAASSSAKASSTSPTTRHLTRSEPTPGGLSRARCARRQRARRRTRSEPQASTSANRPLARAGR